MTFLAIQALLPLAPSELGHVYEHGLLPNVSLSSAGHQPVSEDWIHALLLRHSSCLQTPIVPPISPAQDRSEAAGPGRTPGGQPRRKWVTRQRYSSQAQAPPCDRDEARESGKGQTEGSPTRVCCYREHLQRTPPPLYS